MASEAILLKDARGEKISKLLQTKSAKTVYRGELLLLLQREKVIPRKDGRPAHNYQVASDLAVTLYCPEDDVAPLSNYEYHLMKGIKSREARYEVFQKDLLDWGSKLKVGDFVYATLPSKSPVPNQLTVSRIEYVGPLPNEYGVLFGVEIMDPECRNQGSSNGYFGGHQFFNCEENAALFVSLDRLLPMDDKIQNQNLPGPQQPPQPSRHGSWHPGDNQDYQYSHGYQSGPTYQHGVVAPLPHGYANVPAKEVLHSFSIGSCVQLDSEEPHYGIVEWIGTMSGISGHIAGVELEEPMEGCGDGMWKGVRYFSCRQGHGFFCPLSSLIPDQRFTQTIVTDANPLDYVAFDEEHDQHINVGQINRYIGESKGIQGQQNSCYLDSTLFGLFAVSDAFDNMFLQQQQGDPAGDEVKHLLWKGIVNPLRRNGVVRHESVMRLRNKLEELGKMKRVNQDEKDPEEFLNMLFKHTLHVPPFINIKRPYGVEREYFVHLFVEPDDSIKLPTVEDLLGRMFKEQKICFTKVPSKLLIQIPRYGRQFKTYQKTIPSIKLKLKGLISSKRKCFICADSATNKCAKCVSHFKSGNPSPPDVVYFCDVCTKLTHRWETGHRGHRVTEVLDNSGSITEFELLSVICIETSHYICFTRSENKWIFFDSMAHRVNDMYNIPKVVDCTDDLNEWVYPANGDLSRLINTPPRELPEYVRRFTQDIYLCVYIQPDVGMYGDFECEDDSEDEGLIGEVPIKDEDQIEPKKNDCAQLKVDLREKELTIAELEETLKQKELTIAQLEENCQEKYQTIAALEEDCQKKNLTITQLKAEKQSLLCAQQESTAFGIEPWKVPRDNVQLGRLLGGGGWGVVNEGKLKVAVKQFYPNILSERNISRLKREMRMLALIRHPNLLQFIAAVFDENDDHEQNPPYIITELLDTSLRSAYEKKNIPSSSLLSIFLDTARALDYLHRRHEAIIHRDVSSANVLLRHQGNKKWIAKLSDLGSANLAREAYTMNEGARVYCAPEAFTFDTNARSAGTLSPKVDVYSYGIVLCEVATSSFPDDKVLQTMLTRVRREWPQLHQLIVVCISQSPEQRPSMASVIETLEAFPPQN